MKVLIIADDEFVGRRIPDGQADLVVSLGDMPDSVILAVAGKCQCREILAVKGNHDSSAPFPPPIRDLHLTAFQFQGLTFGGFCGSWKYKPRGNYLFEQDEVERHMASFPPVDVFVAHNSPRFIHDRDDEVHIGFVAFSNYLARARPKYFLHGHQHHNEETTVGTTRVIGTFGYRYLTLPTVDLKVLEFIKTSSWCFAKTMPQWPHEYVVRTWRPEKQSAFERFVLLIRDQGYDAPFLDDAIYRYLEIDGWKYWTMGGALDETTLINRAKVEAAAHGLP